MLKCHDPEHRTKHPAVSKAFVMRSTMILPKIKHPHNTHTHIHKPKENEKNGIIHLSVTLTVHVFAMFIVSEKRKIAMDKRSDRMTHFGKPQENFRRKNGKTEQIELYILTRN